MTPGRVRGAGHATRVGDLVRACHPGPTVFVTVVATALAVSAGRGAASLAVTAAFLSGQLSVGWSNDWIDAARDRAVGRRDKPVVSGLPVSAVRRAALVAAALCVPLSFAMGRYAGAAHVLAVASAWSYNARLKATWASWAPYALSFGLLPSIIVLGTSAHRLAPWWATAAAVCLGVAAHLATVLPDLTDDAVTGVRGLPHRLGRTRSSVLSAGLLLAACLLLARGAVAAVAAALAAAAFTWGLVRARQPHSRSAFHATLAVAGLDVVLLVARGAALG